MAGNRTLKLSILADVDNLKKGLNQADGDVEGFGGKLDGFAKKAGIAFAVAGAAALAYAGKLAIDGVKAAIEDEAAQLKLATTLKNVTGATENQTKAVEDYIFKTELAYGVTDDQLRPSLDRLVRSTKDVAEAQKLQTLALNIAAGTGKDLTQVSEALAKAHDGNFGALKRLGVSIDESIIKSKDFDAATAALATTFKDQASLQADTFDGKMRRLSVAFNESKETIGGFILDAIQPLIDSIVKYVVPAVAAFSGALSGGEGLKGAIQNIIDLAKVIFIPIIEGIKYAFDKIKTAVADNKDEFEALFVFIKNYIAPFLGGVLKVAIEGIGTALSVVITIIGKFIAIVEKAWEGLKKLVDLIKNNPVSKFFGASFEGTGANIQTAALMSSSALVPSAIGGGGGGGGFATAEQQARIDAARARRLQLEEETARIRARVAARAAGDIYGTTNINIGVATDPEGTARAIVDLINQSSVRGSLTSDSLLI